MHTFSSRVNLATKAAAFAYAFAQSPVPFATAGSSAGMVVTWPGEVTYAPGTLEVTVRRKKCRY